MFIHHPWGLTPGRGSFLGSRQPAEELCSRRTWRHRSGSPPRSVFLSTGRRPQVGSPPSLGRCCWSQPHGLEHLEAFLQQGRCPENRVSHWSASLWVKTFISYDWLNVMVFGSTHHVVVGVSRSTRWIHRRQNILCWKKLESKLSQGTNPLSPRKEY